MPFDLSNLVYRGDSRAPELIFPFGFSRRKNTWEHFEKRWASYLDEAFGKWLKVAFKANKDKVAKRGIEFRFCPAVF